MTALWIKSKSGNGIKFNYWDKPKRKKNKLNLNGIDRAKIRTCNKKQKEEILKGYK